MSPSNVLLIWSPASRVSRTNLEFGVETHTWGFRRHESAYDEPFEYVLFGHRISHGGPRQPLKTWQRETASVILGRRTGGFFTGTAPHWPDEFAEGRIIYPERIGFTPIVERDGVPLSPDGPLGVAGSDGLRRGGGNRGIVESLDLTALLTFLGVTRAPTGEPDLSQTPGVVEATDHPSTRSRRAGRSSDPLLTTAVEQHAVRMATRHLQDTFGWTVKELGKPYDLVCTTPSGGEKHVEVKGTTGAGGEVEYTPNEVRHFRECPAGADLIVVRDIRVDRTTRPYSTSGGELRHIENYRAPASDLQATGWLGRVDGW